MPPLTCALMPRPAASEKSLGSIKETPASLARIASALAVGWLLYFSAEAARRSNSAGLVSPMGARRLTANSPVVRVPVLSKMKALILAASSISATFLMRIPRRAAAERAATMAVGVARMKAQGQLKMMTEITLSRRRVNAQTSAAMTSTSGV